MYVRKFCPDSLLGEPTLARYYLRYCASDYWIGNRIHYWNLNAPGVTCRTGSFSNPDVDIGCSDFGLKVFNQFYFSRTRRSLEHYYPQANIGTYIPA